MVGSGGSGGGNYLNKVKQIEMPDCPERIVFERRRKKWKKHYKFEEYFLKFTHRHTFTQTLARSLERRTFSIFQYKSYLSSIKFKQIGSIFRINNVKLLLLFLAHFTATKRRGRRRGRSARRRYKSLIFNRKTGSNEMLVTWKNLKSNRKQNK